jgi:plasmid stabilization system protein ParE
MAAAPPAQSSKATVPSPMASDRTLYTCVTDGADRRKQTAIELEPKVASLCARHPEMGPCQYEREVCRKSGGRVFAQGGQEITRRTEDEYDRKVMRVRFRAN